MKDAELIALADRRVELYRRRRSPMPIANLSPERRGATLGLIAEAAALNGEIAAELVRRGGSALIRGILWVPMSDEPSPTLLQYHPKNGRMVLPTTDKNYHRAEVYREGWCYAGAESERSYPLRAYLSA